MEALLRLVGLRAQVPCSVLYPRDCRLDVLERLRSVDVESDASVAVMHSASKCDHVSCRGLPSGGPWTGGVCVVSTTGRRLLRPALTQTVAVITSAGAQ